MTVLGWRNGRTIRNVSLPVATRRHRARYRLAAHPLEQCEDRILLATILGTAQNFAVLASSTLTNTGATAIVGNVGVSPGSAITGLSPGDITGGTLHANDAAASQAESDLATAYGVISGEASAHDLTGQDLGGLTLTPGVYHFDSSATLTGTLTLNAEGNPNARFDFQIGSTLITASNSAIQIINGARVRQRLFSGWRFRDSWHRIRRSRGIFSPTRTSRLNSGASMLEGRALSLDGAVSLDANQISAAEADVSVTTTSSVGPVLAGANVGYTITIANAGPDAAQVGGALGPGAGQHHVRLRHPDRGARVQSHQSCPGRHRHDYRDDRNAGLGDVGKLLRGGPCIVEHAKRDHRSAIRRT